MELHYRRSLASRVTLLATVAVGFSVAAVALAAYFTVRQQLLASMDDSLLSRAHTAAKSTAIIELGANKVPAGLVGAGDVKILFINSKGAQGAADNGPRAIVLGTPETRVAQGLSPDSVRTISTKTGRFRVVAVPTVSPGLALVLAQSLEPNEDTLDRLGAVLFFFGALGVLAAALAGWGVARNGLRPVRRLTAATEKIARTEELDPIPVEGNDEIARLAHSFNAMLAALAASRDRQRQLVADASHELRTPLTSMRTNLDLLMQADARGGLSDGARRELMNDVRFQIEELTTLIGDLTELARDEPVAPELGEVDLADVVERAIERVRRRATGLTFHVRLSPWPVNGERAGLERAVTNMLDNAVKWSPPLGAISVTLEGGTVEVVDEGPGIRDEDLPHVFDRFYRSKEARTMTGSGLGLSIVRQVAERHGGDARADRAVTGGARIRLTVPRSPTRPGYEIEPELMES